MITPTTTHTHASRRRQRRGGAQEYEQGDEEL
jgi:hypothetical protein